MTPPQIRARRPTRSIYNVAALLAGLNRKAGGRQSRPGSGVGWPVCERVGPPVRAGGPFCLVLVARRNLRPVRT
jgi:hypothetical protein